MDDTPAINDGADTSLRKTVSLLNKIEAKTGSTTLTGPVTIDGGPLATEATLSSVASKLETVKNDLADGVAVTGPLTDSQLRGAPVSVNGTITATPRSGTISKAVKQRVSVANTSFLALNENLNRKYLLVQNHSQTVDLYLGIGYPPTIDPYNDAPSINSGNGIVLPKKGGGIIFEGSYIPTAAIYLRGEQINAPFVVIEA